MFDETVQAFGKRAGLSQLEFNANGVAALEVKGLGRFQLERNSAGDILSHSGGNGGDNAELLLYLAFDLAAYDKTGPSRVLELCHWRHAHPLPLAGGVHAGQAVLLTRLPERQVTVRALEDAFQFLAILVPQIRANGV